MEERVARCAPLSRRCGRGIWHYLYPSLMGEPRPGELVVVPFRRLGLFPALVVGGAEDERPHPRRRGSREELERVVGRIALPAELAGLGRRLYRLFERLGLHPLEGAQVAGLAGSRPILTSFFFALSPNGRWG